MTEKELDDYLQYVADEGDDFELEGIVNTLKTIQNQQIAAQQKAWQEAAMDDWHMRQVKEAQREVKLREDRVKHERKIQAAEDLLRKERDWDPSRGT